jgi:hypothetical protein
MTKDEALKLALETLESIQAVYPCETVGRRITAIKEALAQPAPVQETTAAIDTLKFLGYTYHGGEKWKPPLGKRPDWLNEPAQQEPATRPCRSCGGSGERNTGIDEAPTSICKPCSGTGQISTTPPAQRTWVDLTHQQFTEATDGLEDLEDCWMAIQAKLKEVNI